MNIKKETPDMRWKKEEQLIKTVRSRSPVFLYLDICKICQIIDKNVGGCYVVFNNSKHLFTKSYGIVMIHGAGEIVNDKREFTAG
jgi:hypothetical protein